MSNIHEQLDAFHCKIIKIQYSKQKQKILFQMKGDSFHRQEISSMLEKRYPILGDIPYEIEWEKEREKEPITIESFKKYIIHLLPSACKWVENCNIQINEEEIFIEAPNQMVLERLNQVVNISALGKTFLIENQSLNISCQTESCCSDDFCTNLVEKENSISTNFQKEYQTRVPKTPTPAKSIEDSEETYIFGKNKFDEVSLLSECLCPSKVTIEVDVFSMDVRVLKDGLTLAMLSCTDGSDSRMVKVFVKKEQNEDFYKNVKTGSHLLIQGKYDLDKFDQSQVIMASNIMPVEKFRREDSSPEKRIEFHLHSKMSNTDGKNSIDEYIKRAASWGHKAIGLTDYNVVQAYPEAMHASHKHKIQVLYGLDGDVVDDEKKIYKYHNDEVNPDRFVVFDIETTGFSPKNDEVTEIGAVKIENGRIIERFSEFVNPQRKIPEKIVELTGITDEMVKNADPIERVLSRFEDFIEDCILVAHNADFDSRFIEYRRKGKNPIPIIDTLLMAQCITQGTKNYKLGTLAKFYGISLTNAHRAVHDAEATAELFLILRKKAIELGKVSPEQWNTLRHPNPEKLFPNHMTIYAKNRESLFHLYKLISKSHMENFYRTARILRSDLIEKRPHFILGTGGSDGELMDSYLRGAKEEELKKIAHFYDFIEVQPPIQYEKFYKDRLLLDKEQIEEMIRYFIDLGKQLNIPVIATGNVHYMEPEDEIFHEILTLAQNKFGAKGEVGAFFYTTEEMLKAFEFLGEEEAKKIVIDAPNHLLNEFEVFDPIPSGKYPPKIENAEEDLKNQTLATSRKIYGDPLPEIVDARLKKELDSIIGNGYAVMYKIAQELVQKSNDDGYYVGSRGSVGSSLVATMSGITEVNPLDPHYVCPNCQYSEFITDGSYSSGVDLPDKACPQCGTALKKDGHQIPFEVFLGFYGDKEPDIDLNFAGEYQSKAHKFIEDTFGSGYVFRAGTIGTLAEKTAYGYVQKFCEQNQLVKNPVEIDRLSKGIVGVKRTSGQHPGGIMIVPKTNDIHEFTPIQYPADDKRKNVITTHFDYHSISENILKLDILGHDAPTILRMLEDFTGVSMDSINIRDPKVMDLFLSSDSLEMNEDIFKTETGTLGIPEFGTNFVIKMLKETQPKTFSELVNISGLSHGTDVWTDNAQTLVKNGVASIGEVICTREDIMNYLIQAGAENKMAFDVMEAVRKGKGLPEKYISDLNELVLPPWYLESCQKIKYMFPKAHAVAYVMTSVRIAWYKVYYPLAFYAAYFTTKLSDFNGAIMIKGLEGIQDRMKEIESLEKEPTKKEKDEYNVLQIALEMYSRGYEFAPIDLYESHYNRFKIYDDKVLLPFQSLQGVGEVVAKNLMEEAQKGEFLSVEDMVRRTSASKSVIEALEENGVLEKLPKNNQLSLMDIIG
ncbi:PolC-type DNA polymerase III [Peptoniphilus sp. KCTC 25270]|uniref:PolC-type DNA polymerase III n=1 Tax=Peptoniphilus sp. KCTC 25270 TaxID=2897414 RepID=UPI001E400418|nr:PolC-type DNA polymerase III [Peptoniphilus sp. KCTC 25270]MCD1146985.1 PolC-type DNA polymerase III [Peptoniphilus sp. KCTC 25270]